MQEKAPESRAGKEKAAPETTDRRQTWSKSGQCSEMQIKLALGNCDLPRRVRQGHLNEDRHEFWALVKYVENVQEALVQLDTERHDSDRGSTSSAKKQRSHGRRPGRASRGAEPVGASFENINHNILWETANNQFPVLEGLLRVLQFGRVTQGKGSWSFKVGLWRRLPVAVPGGRLDGSNSLPAIFFDDRGVAMCVRIGRVADDRIAMHSTADGVSLGSIRLMDPDGEAPPETLWPTSNSSYGVAGGAASFGYHE